MTTQLGTAWAQAVAAKDDAAVRQLLHPELDFRAMTPRRIWEAENADDVLDAVHLWFEDSDDIEELVDVETDEFADIDRVSYRFRIRNPDGLFLVEQQMYLREVDGQIGYARIMCSGYRELDAE